MTEGQADQFIRDFQLDENHCLPMKALLTYIRNHEKDPNGQEWNYSALSKNPHLTWALMRENLDFPWNYSANPNITEELILAHPEINWNLNKLAKYNSQLPLTFFLERMDPSGDWGYALRKSKCVFSLELVEQVQSKSNLSFNEIIGCLSQNVCLTLEDILAHPELPWDRFTLSFNPHLTLNFVISPPPFVNRGMWHWRYLSRHPNITWAQIQAHSGLPWKASEVLRNLSLTEVHLTSIPATESLYIANINPKISLQFALDHPNMHPIVPFRQKNPSIRLEEVLSLINRDIKGWDWSVLLKRIRGSSYESQLKVLAQERTNIRSYWSSLPKDMLNHYLGRYFD